MQEAIFEAVRAVPKKVDFEVVVKVPDHFSDVVDFEIRELERITRYATNVEIPTREEMSRYLKTLLYLRVKDSIGMLGYPVEVHSDSNSDGQEEEKQDRKKTVLPNEGSLRHAKRQLAIPVRWYTLLSNIGISHDRGKNYYFTPVLGFDHKDLMKKEELIEFSMKIDMFYRDGYTTIKGIPNQPEGSLALMSMTHLEGTVRGIDANNPIYGFLAYLVGLENERTDLDVLFTQVYSSEDTYKMGFNDYFRSVSKEEPETRNDIPQEADSNTPNEEA